MNAELLRRAAEVLRTEDVPDGTWHVVPEDPRPNFALDCDAYRVVTLNWDKESRALPELMASLLTARTLLADLMDTAADAIAVNGEPTSGVTYEVATVARAVLWERS